MYILITSPELYALNQRHSIYINLGYQMTTFEDCIIGTLYLLDTLKTTQEVEVISNTI